VALQLAHGFNLQTCVCNRAEREKEREQARFVSMLINPFHIRFVSSPSALERVFTAHSPRKALGTYLPPRKAQDYLGTCSYPAVEEQALAVLCNVKELGNTEGKRKRKPRACTRVLPPGETHTPATHVHHSSADTHL